MRYLLGARPKPPELEPKKSQTFRASGTLEKSRAGSGREIENSDMFESFGIRAQI